MKFHRLSWLAFVCALLMFLSVSSYAFASDLFFLQSPVDRELESISTESSETEVDGGVAEEESVQYEEVDLQVDDESTSSSDLTGDTQTNIIEEDPEVNGNMNPSDTSVILNAYLHPTPVGNEPPVADAGGPYYGHVGVDIRFDGSGSWDPDGNIVGYRWDFNGDGTWETGWLATPIYYFSYTTADVYDVLLKVKDDGDDDGFYIKYDTDTTEAYITVNQNPVADIDPDHVQELVGEEVSLYGGDSYDEDGIIANYKWYVQDDYGYWELISEGENEIYFNKTFYQINTYYIKLLVVDDDDASGSVYADVIVHNGEDPSAVIGLVETAEVDENITFDGSGSWDPDGFITDWYWDFNDGITDSGENVFHSYENAGSYVVKLTVTDNYGNTHMSKKRINISDDTGGVPSSGNMNLDNIDLLLDGSVVPSGSLKLEILERISQTLSKISIGSMLLSSINSKIEILSSGDSSTTNFLDDALSISIFYSPWPCHENEEITFTCNFDSGYNESRTYEYSWFWDDQTSNTTTDLISAVHTYAETGSYSIALQVTDNFGEEATTITTVIVEEAEGVNLNISSYNGASADVSTLTSYGSLGL